MRGIGLTRWRKTVLASLIIVLLVLGTIGFELYTQYEAGIETSHNIKISGLAAQDITVRSATLVFTLNLTNPSSYPTPVFSADFSVFLDGVYVANGTVPQISVSARSSTFQQVNLPFTYDNLGASIITTLRNRSYTITVKGTIPFRSSEFVPDFVSIPARGQSCIDLK